MSKITRLAVLVVGMMSLFAMLSASAGAVTWDNSGGTNFTATGGAGTLSSTAASLSCTGSDASGDAPNNVVGVTYAVSGTVTFTSCVLAGIQTSVDCGFTLTGSTQIGTGFGSKITGNVDATCGIYQFGTKICHAASSTLHGIYTNPAAAGGAGSLTVTAGSVTTSNGTSGTCPLGNGDIGNLTHLNFVTGASAPVITRTA